MSSASVERDDTRFKILVAIILSLLLHMLIIGGVAVVALQENSEKEAKKKAEEKPVELVFIDPPQTPSRKPIVDNRDAVPPEKPPENAPFQGTQDSVAASPLPAEGQLPIPTQDGRDEPGMDFINKNYKPGELEGPKNQSPAQSQPAQVKEQQPQPVPQPQTELALLDPPKPKEESRRPRKDEVETPQSKAEKTVPTFESRQRITRLKGNLSNRGRSSVAANATPLGRYQNMVADSISSRWYYYVNDRMDMLTIGTLDARFIIDPSGKVEKVKILRNTSNEIFAATCVRSITEAEFPPFPPDVGKVLEGGRMEVDFSFTIMSN